MENVNTKRKFFLFFLKIHATGAAMGKKNKKKYLLKKT